MAAIRKRDNYYRSTLDEEFLKGGIVGVTESEIVMSRR